MAVRQGGSRMPLPVLLAFVEWLGARDHISYCLAFVKFVELDRKHSRKRKRGPRRDENFTRLNWTTHVNRMAPAKFRRRYRMDSGCFDRLVDALRGDLERYTYDGCRGEPISAELQVALTLRMLAGVSYLDLSTIFRVHESAVYKIFWRVVQAVCNEYKIEFPFDNKERLRHMEAEFRSRSEMEAMQGCVGCIDGLLIKIRAPTKAESACSKRFHSRKNFFAVNAQAVCDVHGRFTVFEVRGGGSQSDIQVWKTLDIRRDLLEKKRMPSGFWIAGDAAYPCSDCVIGPYSDVEERNDRRKDNFNWSQSQLRISIEMAFDKLVGRFGILWKPMHMSYDRAAIVAMACAQLHNVIITYDLDKGQHYSDAKKRTSVEPPSQLVRTTYEEIESDRHDASYRRRRAWRSSMRATTAPKLNKHGAPIELLNDGWFYAASHRTCALRESLTNRVAELGVVRPFASSSVLHASRQPNRQ